MNVNATFYTTDNGGGGGVFASYNADTDIGLNGGTQNIASSQAFWIQTNAANPQLIVDEMHKTSTTPTFFRKSEPANVLRIALGDGQYTDEMVIHFREGSIEGFDTFDSYKQDNEIFNISSLSIDAEDMGINTTPFPKYQSTFELNITNIDVGDFTLTFNEMESFETTWKIVLVDNFALASVEIMENPVYQFQVTSDTLSFGSDRFEIVFTPEVDVITSINTKSPARMNLYPNPATKIITLEYQPLSNEDVTVVLYNSMGSVLYSKIISGGTSLLELQFDVAAERSGVYFIRIIDGKTTLNSKFIKK